MSEKYFSLRGAATYLRETFGALTPSFETIRQAILGGALEAALLWAGLHTQYIIPQSKLDLWFKGRKNGKKAKRP